MFIDYFSGPDRAVGPAMCVPMSRQYLLRELTYDLDT